MTSPETKEIPKKPEEVKERQEEFIVPEKIQDVGLKTTRTQVTAQVSDDDDDDQNLLTTPTRKVTVTLPEPQETIENWTKGDSQQSSTWLGFYWVRMIKKAFHFGWNVVIGDKKEEKEK